MDEFLSRTVPHEMAHILQFIHYPHSKPHGREWDQFCRVLTGATMPRCHSYDVTGIKRTRKVKKYLFACGCRQHKISSTIVNRIMKGSVYTCKCCKGKIEAV
jgi:SprT protein